MNDLLIRSQQDSPGRLPHAIHVVLLYLAPRPGYCHKTAVHQSSDMSTADVHDHRRDGVTAHPFCLVACRLDSLRYTFHVDDHSTLQTTARSRTDPKDRVEAVSCRRSYQHLDTGTSNIEYADDSFLASHHASFFKRTRRMIAIFWYILLPNTTTAAR